MGNRQIGRRALLGAAGLGALAGGAWWLGPDRLESGRDAVLEGAREAFQDVRDSLPDAPDAAAPAGPRPAPQVVRASQLTSYRQLAGSQLRYEVDNVPARFPMDAAFASQLDASLRSHWQARRWGVPGQLSCLGTHRQAPAEQASSWHHAGRAFDLAAVRTTAGRDLVSCRFDRWGNGPDHAAQAGAYWRIAATLHRDFAYVLTYLYDSAHHDHIHLDNGLSGSERSRFTRSRVQVQAVQAICTYVWDRPVELSGRWDSATADATDEVLAGVGAGGRLGRITRSQDAWHTFLSATARHP